MDGQRFESIKFDNRILVISTRVLKRGDVDENETGKVACHGRALNESQRAHVRRHLSVHCIVAVRAIISVKRTVIT